MGRSCGRIPDPAPISVVPDRYSCGIPEYNKQHRYNIAESAGTGIADHQAQRQLYCGCNIHRQRQKYIVYITDIDKRFGRIDNCGDTVDCIIL